MRRLVYIVFATVFLCGMWGWKGGEAKGQNLPPPGELWLEVDQGNQLLRIMRGSVPIRITLVSSGKPATPTPNGTFSIQNRGRFFSVGYASAKYFTSFKGWGKYMFHSILFDAKGRKILPGAAERLGTKDSHGCIRLPLHDAFWIYSNVPGGTKVKIFGGVPTAHKKAFTLEVDGKKIGFKKQPRWIAGKLYVPARDMASWLGGQIGWAGKNMTASMASGGQRVELPVSIPTIKVNGVNKQLKLPALLIYETTWVPFEDVAEELGYQTFWHGDTLLATKAIPVFGAVPDAVYSGKTTVPLVVYSPIGQ